MGEGIKTRRGKSKGQVISKTYLYNEGDECSDLTGGWSKGGYTRGSGTLTKNATDMTLYTNMSGSQTVSVLTNSKIDLTGFNSLCIDVTCTQNKDSGVWSSAYIVASRNTTSDVPEKAAFVELNDTSGIRRVYAINVLAINQSLYIGVTSDTGVNSTQTIKIHKVWLE